MTLNPDSYNAASTAIHIAQGGALLVLGFTEAYAGLERGKRIKLFSPAALLLAGIAMAAFILYFLGGWSFENALGAMKMKNGFFIFVSFACFYAAAGLSQLTFIASEEKGRGWFNLFLLFLAVIAVLYFGVAGRVGPAASSEVGRFHSGLGITLLVAVTLKLMHGFSGRRKFHLGWAVLLMLVSVQLLSYREVKGAFDLNIVSLQADTKPVTPAVPVKIDKNAKNSPSKRAGN